MVHYFSGLTDSEMVIAFGLPMGVKDPKTGRTLTDSEVVAAWFQLGCK